MSNTVIKVENLGKQYRLGTISTRTLSRDLERWFCKIMGKPDPFLKIGETNDRTQKGNSEFVWALKDISFEVKQGEILGIIGRNGAGKSTLLKILSRTTTPTVGNVKIKGRVASLLEVGTGFHPELTGKENIFLNGAILGMTKAEIKRKFDEIVEFAGVARYIDTPVKRYSSGMYVRLAFAVAAHLEPEILVVDEVLAVGDAEFQKKCLGKMKDVSDKEGRTVLFVSHDMRAIRQITQRAILMQQGTIFMQGETNKVCDAYLSISSDRDLYANFYPITNDKVLQYGHLLREIRIESAELITATKKSEIYSQEPIELKIAIQSYDEKVNENVCIGIRIVRTDDVNVGSTFSSPFFSIAPKEKKMVHLLLEDLQLAPGTYYTTLWISQGDETCYGKDYDSVDKVCYFDVLPPVSESNLASVWYPTNWGAVRFKSPKILQIENV